MRRLIPALVLGAVLASCGDPQASTDAAATTEVSAARAKFWMPAVKAEALAPSGALGRQCKEQVDVELSVKGELITGAMLTDEVYGPCHGIVLGNKRFYELKMVAVDCGTRVYEGTLNATGGASRIRLLDHAQRRCGDAKRYSLEIEETHPNHAPRSFGAR